MVTKEEILTFFEANPQLKKESLYQNYSIMDYSYDSNQKKHRLTINPYYEIEKSGDLHSDLYKLIFSEKRDIVYFWTKDKPNAGKLFTFVGKDRYYWTIFPKWDFFESQEAQEWLDKTYPPEKRSNYTYLDISNKNLKGNLKLEGFINISFLNCSQNLLTNLDLSENVKLTELKCQNNELVSLDLSQNKKLVNLNCYANKLIEIILSNEELTRVDCSNNLLTNLDLNNCNNLESLKVHNYEQGHESFNELSNVNFLNQLPNPKKLKILWLYANNIQSDLTLFSSFASLEDLDLGMNNFSEEFTKKRGNKFHGSLEPLKNLTKLKKLDISNTDIENGLEHLPASVEEISCAIRERPESKVKEIVKQLNSSLLINENRNKYYLAEKWKNIHEGFVSTPWFRNDWEEWGFTYKDCKEWISAGLSPSDANFARYLRKQGRAREKGLNLSEIKILRGEYDIYLKNLEQEWKGLNYHSSTIISLIKKGFDYKEFEQWIKLGFKIEEVWQIKEWKKHNFNIDQIKKWNNVGLGVKEVELASYLQQKGFSYQITKDKVESLRKEFQK